MRSKYFFALAISSVLVFSAIGTEAGPVDLIGSGLPDPGDGKTVKLDNSKEKEVPPIEGWCQAPPPWEVRIGAPGWLAGLSGESGVKGVVASPDVSFDQLLNHLTHFPIALSADARYQRWEFHVDGQYIEVGTSAPLPGLLFTNADVH